MQIGDWKLPNPDTVGQSEYRCLHDFLEESLGALGEENEVENAISLLDEIKDWCDDLQRKLRDIHANAGGD
jgi:hypothetical protein